MLDREVHTLLSQTFGRSFPYAKIEYRLIPHEIRFVAFLPHPAMLCKKQFNFANSSSFDQINFVVHFSQNFRMCQRFCMKKSLCYDILTSRINFYCVGCSFCNYTRSVTTCPVESLFVVALCAWWPYVRVRKVHTRSKLCIYTDNQTPGAFGLSIWNIPFYLVYCVIFF